MDDVEVDVVCLIMSCLTFGLEVWRFKLSTLLLLLLLILLLLLLLLISSSSSSSPSLLLLLLFSISDWR